MSILGTRVLRREDEKFLTVGGTYVDDVVVPGAAWVVYVRSPVAHARIERTDLEQARGAPGVIDVVAGPDLGLAPLSPDSSFPQSMGRPLLAQGVVRFVGEPVVAVVANSRAEAVDAAEM
ncbi:MAG TPA: xanthine dehydrogenase family protein molybdopterin-binding subunit, partial [Acidimicrobiales bacterium]|nr:xanthine dehydrogenase family protein molybdopterin-binding subunit [Acidimicrobiales bacterium]